MNNIILIGASQHARYAIDIIERQGDYIVVGLVDDSFTKEMVFEGSYKLLGASSDLPSLIRQYHITHLLITIGDNYTRYKIANKLTQLGIDLPYGVCVHPSAVIGKHVEIGEGTLVMAGVIINNNSTIGEHCFLATKASLDHDSVMGDYASLSPGVTTGGCVHIGVCTAIGLGANIIHGRKIGDHTVIGSGALVVKDIESHRVAYGIPARVVRQRAEGERYL